MYRISGYSPSASRNPCSTVPGFPNMYVIPSASSCSTMAKRPVLRCHGDAAQVAAPTALGWNPHCLRPVSSTSTIFCPVRYESGVERPVTNG